MKKIFFITILLLVGLCKINALDQQNITCERAWEIVLRDVLKNNTELSAERALGRGLKVSEWK